jgi:hypothetical protein
MNLYAFALCAAVYCHGPTGCRMRFLFAKSCESRTPAKIEQNEVTSDVVESK